MGLEQAKRHILHFDDVDSEYCLVLVHGGPGLSHHYFFPLIDAVREDVNVIAYDQGSQLRASTWSVSTLAAELNSIIVNRCAGKTAVVLGHSFGGAVAIEYASTFSSTTPLILMNWVFDKRWIQIFEENTPNSASITEQLNVSLDRVSSPEEQFKLRMLAYAEYYFSRPYQLEGEALFERIAYNPQIEASIGDWYAGQNFEEKMRNLKGPVLSLSGTEDRVVYPSYNVDAIRHMNRAKHITVKDAGHFPFVEKPDDCRITIKNFIQSLDHKGE